VNPSQMTHFGRNNPVFVAIEMRYLPRALSYLIKTLRDRTKQQLGLWILRKSTIKARDPLYYNAVNVTSQ